MPTPPPLAAWLQRQYALWLLQQGQFRTQAEFANYLGIHHVQFNKYFNGARLPRGSAVARIAARLGPEIYTILGLVPDPEIGDILELWQHLTPDQRTHLRETAAAYFASSGAAPDDSPPDPPTPSAA